MTHYLKTLKEYFEAIEDGSKPFEVRYNDRGFRTGDTLVLKEWDGWEYTGKDLTKTVTYVLDNPHYCKEGFVILGIK